MGIRVESGAVDTQNRFDSSQNFAKSIVIALAMKFSVSRNPIKIAKLVGENESRQSCALGYRNVKRTWLILGR